jgi:catechol 2,3-dioxygenase-like lactoylglutathione lyase family enzyme
MAISLDHTIVWATDQRASARFLADALGLSVGPRTGPFLPLPLDNGVTLDYAEATSVTPQHYAFTVDDHTFTTALAHLVAAGIPYYADRS